jgi:hypothetical protein
MSAVIRLRPDSTGIIAIVVALLLIGSLAAAQEMPDPALIHGRALPAPELRDGTVTVRVVRQAIGNDAPGQQVRVTVGGVSRTATTDQEGRAEFIGLPAGEARAEATVDGEVLQSQPFQVPTSGGLRVILVAGLSEAAARKQKEEADALAAPPVKGIVVLGGDSRIVMEFNNDSLFGFYLLDIVNTARTRVDIGGPLQIELPREAAGVQIREGSSKSAEVDGTHLTIHGPFAPGTTSVQVEFNLQFSNSTHTVVQAFPVQLQRTIVGVEKVGSLAMTSPQFSSVAELPTENGVYLLGQGGALSPGTPLTFTLSNLPVHPRTGRYVALALALAIAAVGIWLAINPGPSRVPDRKVLVSRRDTLLGELAQLEAKRRAGTIPERAERRRLRILSELEHIYAELDSTVGPRGGGEGLAA